MTEKLPQNAMPPSAKTATNPRGMTLVFDLGAVLLHWQPVQLVGQMLRQHAPDLAAAKALSARIFEGLHPGSTWADFDRGLLEPEALATVLAGKTGVDAPALLRFVNAIPDHLHTLADTVALLPRLQAQGHRLVYLSNMPLPYSLRLLQERDFFDYFEDGLFSGRIGLVKPEHPIFEMAEARFQLTPQCTVFIDDNADNVATAISRGWTAIQFIDAKQCERDLLTLGLLKTMV